MLHIRRGLVLALCGALAAAATAVAGNATAKTSESGAEVVRWNTITQRTVFTENVTPPPAGQVIIGFVSLAVNDAVATSLRESRHGDVSASAAAAAAAHGVLVKYFPTSKANLDGELAATLATIPAGAARNEGVAIGEEEAAELIASRVGDGWGNTAITYNRAPGIGVWQPAPGTTFAVPWLGFVRPLVLRSPTQIHTNGPDPLTSKRYAADFAEVKLLGEDDSTARTLAQTATARFFVPNVVVQMQSAMRGMATGADIRSAARLFGLANVAAADAIITTWRKKFDYGFWRPDAAIAQAAADGNPATTPPTTPWAPLIANPPYPDYPSGHGTLMGAYTETFRLLGHSDEIHAVVPSLVVGVPDRTYHSADVLEADAHNARIWLGIHFRDAMVDANFIGEQAAHLTYHRLNSGW